MHLFLSHSKMYDSDSSEQCLKHITSSTLCPSNMHIESGILNLGLANY